MGIHGTEPAPATSFISLSFLIHARFKIRPQLSDTNLLVRTTLDLPLHDLHHRNLWDRPSLHVASDHAGWTLVRVSHHSRVGHS